ncbi:MAG: PepSY domain-containing protein [Proteobacteria bacterium]|nr:PepSY domain-containing protein [Pseudomonadota bacterium]
MMGTRSLRIWLAIHRWSSLVSTLVLIVLCVTGLPLIFRAEIDSLAGFKPVTTATNHHQIAIEKIVQAAEAAAPGQAVQFVAWEEDKPGIVTLSMARSPTAAPDENHNLYADGANGQIIPPRGPMEFIRTLHGQLFLGPFGPLVLGVVTCLLLAAIVSGVVVYAPFMRSLAFGTVRVRRAARTTQLDLHNLLGIATAGWLVIVGVTGMINSWGTFVIELWRFQQLGPLARPYEDMPLPADHHALDRAVAAARAAAPELTPSFVAMPGSILATHRHYAVFLRGDTALTSRLVTPVFVDAVTGDVSARLELPPFVKATLLAQPLHFGDYGGLPLKVLWALLDLITIYVLANGVYLWWTRRRSPSAGIAEA